MFNRNNETANIASSSAAPSLSDDYDEVDSDDGGESTSKQRRNATSLARPTASKLYVKLDNGTYVLNDYSRAPSTPLMSQCPANQNDINVSTQSTQKCVISQAVTSSAASVYSSSISVLLLPLLLHLGNLARPSVQLGSVVLVWNLRTLQVLLLLVVTAALVTNAHTSLAIITGS